LNSSFVSVIWYVLLNMDGHAVAALFRAYGIFLWILQDTLRTKQFHRIDTI